jgi:sporulation protein YlmC with PRC-barrel domain
MRIKGERMSLADSHAKGNYIVGVKMSILGANVVNEAKEDLGTIEDVIIDSRTSVVAYAILTFGGFLGLGDKHFAIPWRVLDFHAVEGYAVLKIEKARLENAPGFKTGEWPDMGDTEWACRVDRHYGVAE